MPKNTITDRGTQITELATQAAGLLNQMVTAADASDKKVAFEAYKDVLMLIGRMTIANFDGRTSILTGLVAELTEVTRSIKVKNPVAPQLRSIGEMTSKALDLLKAEKADPT